MNYFLSIGLKNLHLFVNCHSMVKWVICTLFKIYEYYALYFYLNLWLKYVVKYLILLL